MARTIQGILIVLLGLTLVSGNRVVARWAREYNPKRLVGNTSERAYRVAFAVVGCAFAAFGIGVLAGLVTLR